MSRGRTSIAEWGSPKENLTKRKQTPPDYFIDGMHPILCAYTEGRMRASAVDLLRLLQKLRVAD